MQQLGFVPKSMVLGCCIGCILDISSGFWRGKKYRLKLYVSDVVCCALAAVITLFGSLVITDGQLHPMLFVGVVLGVIAEHCLVGRWLSLIICKAKRHLRAWAYKISEKCAVGLRLFDSAVSRMWIKGRKRLKNEKNPEKI